ncbi:MAG TPA: tRNA 2-thiouridine(34) synthase MnmA [Thermoleophilaceae bacterium]|nr:tRNA 2-thiouridine(34) synthase MnmA [Thermoleophilaceae bacterium]
MGDSLQFADHLAAPRGHGALADHPHAGVAGGVACGDLVRIAVRVADDRIAEAGFSASGCGAATAAASATVELIEGGSFLDAAKLTPDDIADELGGLSLAKRHAADLAAEALHRALGVAARDGATRLPGNGNRTLVAMSGGVDSAVAAQLALEEGHEVIAVTLELWSHPDHDGERSCCSPQAVSGARRLAQRMGIPHVTLDLRELFKREVVDDFVDEHVSGRTPNPCVRCNGLVRFDRMLELAERLGAARLATGHYARIGRDEHGPLLRAAADPRKDQTYMLARLEPHELERLWFPLGELEKPAVRELAREHELPVAEKPESQDLCFLAGLDRRRLVPAGEPGEIVDREGRVLGRHQGQESFTVGQRRGLRLAAPVPLYVLSKDPRSARVTVGPKAALATRRVEIAPARLHRPGGTVNRVKLRYRSAAVDCRLTGQPAAGSHPHLTLSLAEPVYGAAPGQTACLMCDDAVVGWGTITKPDDAPAAGAHLEAADAA